VDLCGSSRCPGAKSFQIQIIAATAATPTAESASEANPTISAIFATKLEKLIPTERIPSSSRRV